MKKKKLKSKQTPVAPVKLTHVPPTYFQERRDAIVETIRQAVEIESPTDNKHAVDRLGHWLASKFEALGGHSNSIAPLISATTCKWIFPAATGASLCSCWDPSTPCIPWARWQPCLAVLATGASGDPARWT